ncbi:MAG: TonB family protein [Deltaproteobacteria bacterium]|nr:TonB family protein [Deltaproteobacteria bacterium]
MALAAYHQARPAFTPGVVCGLLFVVVVHAGIPIGLLMTAPILEAGNDRVFGVRPDEPERILEGPPLIEARFMRLGTPRDPRRLPTKNTRAPAATQTAPVPTSGVAVSTERNPTPPTKRRDPRFVPSDVRVDALQRLGDRAQQLSDREQPRQVEGVSAEQGGTLGGTETDPSRAQAGSVYAGTLRRLFQGAWERPPNSSGLSCSARITITSDGRFGDLSITRSSGNPEFDRTVENVLQRFSGRAAPPVPEDEAEHFLGRARPMIFRGR